MGKIISVVCIAYIIITCVYGSITHWIYNGDNKKRKRKHE